MKKGRRVIRFGELEVSQTENLRGSIVHLLAVIIVKAEKCWLQPNEATYRQPPKNDATKLILNQKDILVACKPALDF